MGVDIAGPYGTADAVYALSSFVKRSGFRVRCHDLPPELEPAGLRSSPLPPLIRWKRLAL